MSNPTVGSRLEPAEAYLGEPSPEDWRDFQDYLDSIDHEEDEAEFLYHVNRKLDLAANYQSTFPIDSFTLDQISKLGS